MDTRKIDIYIAIMTTLTVVGILLSTYKAGSTHWNEFVAGETWKHCYLVQHQPATIKKPIYFDSLNDCQQFMNNFNY